MGLYKQGILHDLSKFSPIEFFESVKYYQGTSSPIDACKKDKDYSLAWQHHKGRNPHHYEYWTDNYDKGTTTICMPFEYAAEMLADYLGAGRAYNKENFTYLSEKIWWENKLKTNPKINIATKDFITMAIDELVDKPEKEVLNKKHLKSLWVRALLSNIQ